MQRKPCLRQLTATVAGVCCNCKRDLHYTQKRPTQKTKETCAMQRKPCLRQLTATVAGVCCNFCSQRSALLSIYLGI